MKKLETKNDIIEWATIIVAANGEKFTPMSKGDLFAVAQYILESVSKPEYSESDGDSMAAEGDGKDVETTEECPGHTAAPETAKATGTAEDRIVDQVQRDEYEPIEGWPATEECKYNGEVSCTRAVFYQEQKCSAQRVYDEFLKWCETNPQEANVMDFSNGTYNKGAAFAYWLQGRIYLKGYPNI